MGVRRVWLSDLCSRDGILDTHPWGCEERYSWWVWLTTFLCWESPPVRPGRRESPARPPAGPSPSWRPPWWSWLCPTRAIPPSCPCTSCTASSCCCSGAGRSWRSGKREGSSPRCWRCQLRCLTPGRRWGRSQPSCKYLISHIISYLISHTVVKTKFSFWSDSFLLPELTDVGVSRWQSEEKDKAWPVLVRELDEPVEDHHVRVDLPGEDEELVSVRRGGGSTQCEACQLGNRWT